MSVVAFEGPAGTGKTYNLMEALSERVGARPLADHERVLALTFMHGSRRRLDARMRGLAGVSGRFEATTLDSFAWRLTQRWRELSAALGHALPAEAQYDETCALAAALLERPHVRSWVALSFPFLVVDEAQDLSFHRSEIVRHLGGATQTLVAFDEFQCLNTALLPIPIRGWLPAVCTPISLSQCRRTEDHELLAAATAIRSGSQVAKDGKQFKVAETPAEKLAATYVANAIAWRKNGGSVAILTPSRRGGFAESVVEIVRTEKLGKKGNGPFAIAWESGDDAERERLISSLGLPARCSSTEALALLGGALSHPAARAVRDWIHRRRVTQGADEVVLDDVKRQMDRALSARRHYAAMDQRQFAAMTIQQAKNREFDHVIVIWPHTVPSDAEQKRRLLYNAVTRARRSCLVLVQSKTACAQPPFAPLQPS